MRRVLSGINRFFIGLSENKISQTIRDGMVTIFPVLLLGSVSLLLKNFPLDTYQKFINTFANGFISNLLTLIYNGTFGCISCFVVSTLSISYSKLDTGSEINFGAMLSAIVWFFIFTGILTSDFDSTLLGAQGMFSAIMASLGATALYLFLEKRISLSK